MKLIALLFGAVWVGVAVVRVLWGLLVEAWKLRPTKAASTTSAVADIVLKRRNTAERLRHHAEIFGVEATAECDSLRRQITIRCRRCYGIIALVDFELDDSFYDASRVVGFGAVCHHCTPIENHRETTTVPVIDDAQSKTTEKSEIRKIRFDRKD